MFRSLNGVEREALWGEKSRSASPSALPFLRFAAPAAGAGDGTDGNLVGAGQRGRFGAATGGRDTGQA